MFDFYPDIVGFTMVSLAACVATIVNIIRGDRVAINIIIHGQHLFYIVFTGLSLTRDPDTGVYSNLVYAIAELATMQLQLWADLFMAYYQYTDIVQGYELGYLPIIISSILLMLIIPAISFIINTFYITCEWISAEAAVLFIGIYFCYGKILYDPMVKDGDNVVNTQVETVFSPYFKHLVFWSLFKPYFYVPYFFTLWQVGVDAAVGRLIINIMAVISMIGFSLGGVLSVSKRRRSLGTVLLQSTTHNKGKTTSTANTSTDSPSTRDPKSGRTSKTPRFGVSEEKKAAPVEHNRWALPENKTVTISNAQQKNTLDPFFLNRAFYAGLSSGFTGPSVLVSHGHSDLITVPLPELVIEE